MDPGLALAFLSETDIKVDLRVNLSAADWVNNPGNRQWMREAPVHSSERAMD